MSEKVVRYLLIERGFGCVVGPTASWTPPRPALAPPPPSLATATLVVKCSELLEYRKFDAEEVFAGV